MRVIFLVFICAFASSDVLILDGQLTTLECMQMVQQSKSDWKVEISSDTAWKAWDERLFNVFGDALAKYHAFIGHNLNIKNDSGYAMFRRTKQNDTVAPFSTIQPVGMVMFLNGDVAGGEMLLTRQDRTIIPECGRLVVFPGIYTHPVAFKDVRLGEERFIITYFRS